jgi:ABC-type multidrug transport system ATPase subunit
MCCDIKGSEDLYLNGQIILPGMTYTFDHGSSIRGQNIDPIYYTDVSGIFSTATITAKISFVAREVEFHFKNSKNGIQHFNLNEESGKLIGIMGGSGVGKSTLLNVLNGNLEPQKGEILINGYNLYDEKEREQLNGIIGFIPQDDLLLEDLTVRENLYYNAKLCLNNYSEAEINQVVDEVLKDLDLYEIRDFKVGKPLSKVISGGQRKRVNIGLELIREPSVLFVDEPTSGLSSVDSEMVMNLLREQVFKGKLVIVNIHQPSSTLYKMFDRIIFIDRGGYQIYCGNPSEAVIYFKTKSNHANANEDQCIRCGNVDPDQVLQIIEAKIVNEHGKLSRVRRVSPKEWYELFRGSNGLEIPERPSKETLPENQYSIPGLFQQARIFFQRDVLGKIANKQYVLLTLSLAPMLAAIMAFFTKYFSGTTTDPEAYVFRYNENLPTYLLMSVVVFLFLGLTSSSQEIIKDRKILQRESFLNLSWGSYLVSKIMIMFAISAFQSLSFVLIGNLIFEIKGMLFSYWLILFTAACYANILGLNISSGLNSVITIYILVPFLLIPQIIFCGVLVKYDKLHKSLTNYEYVPVIGDLMASRWAFEALAVNQFKDNRYQKVYFDVDKKISDANYYKAYLVPQIDLRLGTVERKLKAGTAVESLGPDLELIQRELDKLGWQVPQVPAFDASAVNARSFNDSTPIAIRNYLGQITEYNRIVLNETRAEKDLINKALIDRLGGLEAYTRFRNNYDNDQLNDMLLNRNLFQKVDEKDGKLIRIHEPAFMTPTSPFVRAQLYAPVKRIGNLEIDTVWFNIIFLWIYSALLYLVLYYDLLRKLLVYLETLRLIPRRRST